MYSVELKIKRGNLGDEARAIRREEKIAKSRRRTELCSRLHLHRVNTLRPAARAAHLAHVFLRGQPYRVAERTSKESAMNVIDEIRRLVSKYGPPSEPKALKAALREWLDREEVRDEMAA